MFSNGLPCNLSFPSCLSVPKDEIGNEELLPSNMGTREPVILNVYDMVWLSLSLSVSLVISYLNILIFAVLD